MRKVYLFVAMGMASMVSFAQNGNVPNGGFENWTVHTLYDYPTQWNNSNTAEYSGEATVLQSADAHHGTSSCELRAHAPGLFDEPVFGYVAHGTPGEAGIPYTSVFDEIRVWYKCDISVDDSLYLLMFRNEGGMPIDMQVLAVAGGTQNDWTEAILSVPATPQEELVIAFALANPFEDRFADEGSWALIDHVKLYSGGTEQPDVPDFSFEDWETKTVETPDNWFTWNEILAGYNLVNAVKTTDAYAGDYAIELTNRMEPVTENVYNGWVSLADFTKNEVKVPYSATPTNFSGAYNYTPAEGTDDEGYIQVTFYEMGSVVSNYTYTFHETAGYQTFSANLGLAGVPDSIFVFASAGSQDGSVLKLDNVKLGGGDVGLDELADGQTAVYPNPATDKVTIRATGNYGWQLINLTGTVIAAGESVNGDQQFSVNDLPAGIYMVRISQSGWMTTHQLVVQ